MRLAAAGRCNVVPRCWYIVHADARGLCLLCWGMLARTDRTRADLNKVSNAKRIAKLVRLYYSVL